MSDAMTAASGRGPVKPGAEEAWLSRVRAVTTTAVPFDGEPTVTLTGRGRVREQALQCVVVVDLPRREGALRRVRSLIAELTNESRGVVFTIEPEQAQASGAEEPAAERATLSPRERDVLTGLGEGASAKQVAQRLGISVHTCRGYIKTLHAKLDARNQVEALLKAQALGLLDDGPPRPEP